MTKPVIIIGAGVSGLCCGRRLALESREFVILEASDEVGGRVRTDRVEGFQLDRGFQVFLTAYPEAQEVLDYDALNLAPFGRGAIVRRRGGFVTLRDPRENPLQALGSLFSGLGTWRDKLAILRLQKKVGKGSLEDLFQAPQTSTREFLSAFGFSEDFIEGFFRPWFRGVFLESDLQTSSRMFQFLFRMFGEGKTTLCAEGIGAIPKQIAAGLPEGSIRLDTRVAGIDGHRVTTAEGEVLEGDAVVVATSAPAAATLLGDADPDSLPGCGVLCHYFDAPKSPVGHPLIVLDGDGTGPVNDLAVLSDIAASYAPPGRSLLGASMERAPSSSPEAVLASVTEQMRSWFGDQVDAWRHLKSYDIPYALPPQGPGDLSPVVKEPKLADGLYRCGDAWETGSLQGAMASGRRAADAVLGRS